MPSNRKQPARAIFRWLAGFSCLVFVLVAITSAFPGLLGFNDEPSFAMALSLLSGAVCLASIAASGRLPSGAKQRFQLHLLATRYASGNMTLDEYGATTKEILNES